MITTLIASALSLLLAATGTPAAPNAPQATLAGLTPSATTRIGKTADWVLPTDDAVWVASTGPFAVHRLDPKTRGVVASVPLPGEACAGLTIAAGQLWVPLCGKPNALAATSISLVTMSRWLVGSSSTSRFGGSNSIRAMTRRAFSPPDRTRQGFSTSSPEKPKQPASVRSAPCPAWGKAPSRDSKMVSSPSSRSMECWAK